MGSQASALALDLTGGRRPLAVPRREYCIGNAKKMPASRRAAPCAGARAPRRDQKLCTTPRLNALLPVPVSVALPTVKVAPWVFLMRAKAV